MSRVTIVAIAMFGFAGAFTLAYFLFGRARKYLIFQGLAFAGIGLMLLVPTPRAARQHATAPAATTIEAHPGAPAATPATGTDSQPLTPRLEAAEQRWALARLGLLAFTLAAFALAIAASVRDTRERMRRFREQQREREQAFGEFLESVARAEPAPRGTDERVE